jgi:hypothetical protein
MTDKRRRETRARENNRESVTLIRTNARAASETDKRRGEERKMKGREREGDRESERVTETAVEWKWPENETRETKMKT